MTVDVQKVFISYRRRLSGDFALRVFDALRGSFDVFIDIESLGSGEFDRAILAEIEARPHFLIVLRDGSLDGFSRKDDWLRREFEHAQKHRRNIVPVTHAGFDLGSVEAKRTIAGLPDHLAKVASYQSVDVPFEYFAAAMEKIKSRFLTAAAVPEVTPTAPAHRPQIDLLVRRANQKVSEPSFAALFGEPLPAPRLTNVAGTTLASFTKKLSWTTVPGAAEYVLQRAEDSSFENPVEVYRGDDVTFLLPFFSPEALHYRVKAAAGLRIGAWSNVVTVEPLVLRSATQHTAALEAPRLSISGYELSWTVVDGADAYVLERSLSRDFAGQVAIYNGEQTSYSDMLYSAAMFQGITRSYRVQATSSSRPPSPWSNVVSAAAGEPAASGAASPAAAMANFMAPTLSRSPDVIGTRLEWTRIVLTDGYVLQRAMLSGDYVTIYEGNDNSYVDRMWGQIGGSLYSYRVAAKKGDGTLWPWSNVV